MLFFLHPALGPLYEVIAQKIHSGKIAGKAELQINMADVEIRNFEVDGSLRIIGKNSVGSIDSPGVLIYGKSTGKCILKNVIVRNKGIDRQKTEHYWRNQLVRTESFT